MFVHHSLIHSLTHFHNPFFLCYRKIPEHNQNSSNADGHFLHHFPTLKWNCSIVCVFVFVIEWTIENNDREKSQYLQQYDLSKRVKNIEKSTEHFDAKQ